MKIIKIGRDEQNDIVIPDPNKLISRFHAEIKVDDNDKMTIMDNDSTNGVFVNGNRITKYTPKTITKSDTVLLSNVIPLDWEKIDSILNIPESTEDKSGVVASEEKPKPKAKKGFKWGYAFGAFALIIIIAAVSYFFIFNKSNVLTSEEIYEQCAQSVVYIEYYYYFTLNYENNPQVYFGTNQNGQFDFSFNLQSKPLNPLGHSGTGYFIADDGLIITNKHVAFPSKYFNTAQKRINELGEDFQNVYELALRNLNWYYKEGLRQDISSQLVFDEEPVAMLITPNQGILVDYTDMSAVERLEYHEDDNVDLALIQMRNQKLPENCTFININEDMVVNEKLISPGSDVYIIGFPAGLMLAKQIGRDMKRGDRIRATITDGKIGQIPTAFSVQYNVATSGGASGSPVFNSEGKLVATNHAGWGGPLKGVANYGILSKFINDLLQQNKTSH